MIEAALNDYLGSVAEIRAIVAEPDLVRIFNLTVPDGSRYPCLVLQFTGFERYETRCGTGRLVQIGVQIDSYATEYYAAIDLARRVRVDLLENFKERSMMGAVEVRKASIQDERDLDDPEPGLYRRWQDWQIWFVE